MAAPAAAAAAGAAGQLADSGGDVGRSAARGGCLLAGALLLVPILLVLLIATVILPAATNCDPLGVGADESGMPGEWNGPGSLGGVAGTGVTRAELTAAKQRGGATKITAGQYRSTAYAPFAGGVNCDTGGKCSHTASGIRVDQGRQRKYLIASNPRLLSYGALVYIWPNPYKWKGPFVVADTGGDFGGTGRLDFYIFEPGSLSKALSWGNARMVRVSAKPIVSGGPDVGAASTVDDVAEPGKSPGGTVLTVGDSLAVGAAAPLRRRLGGRHLIVNAEIGRGSTAGLAALRARASSARTWVVQLGTNDADVQAFRRNVRSVAELARARGADLYWVNIARRPLYGTTDAQLNAVLRSELGPRQIIDWKGTVASGRARLSDGLHPSAAGYDVRARLIAASLGTIAPTSSTPASNTTDGSSAGFRPPVKAPITSGFGPRSSPGGIGSTNHEGIDYGVPVGTPVTATAAGRVIFAGSMGGYGNYLCILHRASPPLSSCYAHLSAFKARAGVPVAAGQTIALSGNTGNSTGPHLHFEIRRSATPAGDPAVDPRIMLSGVAVEPASDTGAHDHQCSAAPAGADDDVAGTVTPSGGKARWPVAGGRGKIIGLPGQGTHTLGNWQSDNAIDIGIPAGTPLRAVEDGVICASCGYGLLAGGTNSRFAGFRLHLTGSNGRVWFYSHLSRLTARRGQRVKAGEVIGYSGTANGVAHLHLGLTRPNDILATLGIGKNKT